jgi:peptidoglycan hydrolase-like protein with peptidoglycan-binding domain
MPGLDEGEGETTIRIEREPVHVPQPKPDPVIEQVQGILRDLNFYAGTVDGIAGPNTRTAIASYRKKVGLPASDAIDDELLTQLGAKQTTGAIAATPEPAPRETEIQTASTEPPAADALVLKIQAGLKAFGNDGMEVDGVMGSKTKSAIREFQSLFGLPVTGEPDEALYAKMREIGLTN